MEASNISVVITHYNDPEGLDDCVTGWCIQLGADPLEIIVVDDGSSEANLKRAEGVFVGCEVLPITWKLIKHEKNLGVPAAMNTGLREVTGAYVHFASCSDDVDRGFIKAFKNAINARVQGDHLPPDAYFARARWVDDRTGAEWTSKVGDLVSHAAIFRRDRLTSFHSDLRWHCDWWAMKQAGERPAFPSDVVKVIHLKRGQYSDVDRYGDENLDVLHELITKIEGASDAMRTRAVKESWLADFGLPAVIAAIHHPFGRVFLDMQLIRKAAWRELEILGRRYLPAWAQRLAIRLFVK